MDAMAVMLILLIVFFPMLFAVTFICSKRRYRFVAPKDLQMTFIDEQTTVEDAEGWPIIVRCASIPDPPVASPQRPGETWEQAMVRYQGDSAPQTPSFVHPIIRASLRPNQTPFIPLAPTWPSGAPPSGLTRSLPANSYLPAYPPQPVQQEVSYPLSWSRSALPPKTVSFASAPPARSDGQKVIETPFQDPQTLSTSDLLGFERPTIRTPPPSAERTYVGQTPASESPPYVASPLVDRREAWYRHL
ncbi:hypothetical protein DIPPA_65795 [Diplonema papillatum]|nr:hypothetical protein DIPPA_65795 [Diplonema papillatum]